MREARQVAAATSSRCRSRPSPAARPARAARAALERASRAVLDQHGLGDLQLRAGPDRRPCSRERRRTSARQAGVRDLARREVDRRRRAAASSGRAAFHAAAWRQASLQHPARRSATIRPRLLGQRDELARRHQAALGMRPSAPAPRRRDQRAVAQARRSAGSASTNSSRSTRAAQLASRAAGAARARACMRRVEHLVAAAPARLGAVHRGVGVAQQLVRRARRRRRPARCRCCGRRRPRCPPSRNGRAQRADEALGDAPRPSLVADVLAAARRTRRRRGAASTSSAGAAPRAAARPTATQQLVAARVAERVVDDLEAVEVEEEQREPIAAALRAHERVLQAVHQRARFGRPVRASCRARWRIKSSVRARSSALASTFATACAKDASTPVAARGWRAVPTSTATTSPPTRTGAPSTKRAPACVQAASPARRESARRSRTTTAPVASSSSARQAARLDRHDGGPLADGRRRDEHAAAQVALQHRRGVEAERGGHGDGRLAHQPARDGAGQREHAEVGDGALLGRGPAALLVAQHPLGDVGERVDRGVRGAGAGRHHGSALDETQRTLPSGRVMRTITSRCGWPVRRAVKAGQSSIPAARPSRRGPASADRARRPARRRRGGARAAPRRGCS